MFTLTFRSPLTAAAGLLRPFALPQVRRYALLTFLVDAALLFALLVAVQSYLPEQYGASDSTAGYVLAGYGAAKLAGQFGAGWLIDRAGARRGLIAGLLLAAAGQGAMLLGVVQTDAVIPAAALYGLGAAMIWPSIFALAAAEIEEGERARLSAGMTVAMALGVGTAIGLGFILPAGFPYSVALLLSLVTTALALTVAGGFPGTDGREASEDGPAAVPIFDSLRSILTPQRLAFSLMILFQAAILGSLLAIFRGYGRDTLHAGMQEEILLLAPAGLAGACAVMIGGALADRSGRIPVLGAGFLIFTFALWGLSTTSHQGPVIVLAIFAAGGLALAMPCMGALALDLSRGANTGVLLGWFLTMEGLGHAVGPLAAGLIDHAGGASAVLWFAGGLAAVISSVALVPPFWGRRPAGAARPLRAAFAFSGKGVLLSSFAFPVLAAYLAWQPASQIYGHMITHGPRDQMRVALTFDDGPNDPWTLSIADTLQQYNVHGTFFIVGKNAEVHPEIVRSLVERGDLIGNHSYRHRKSDAVRELGYGELDRAERAIAEAGGVCPAIYRPPNGFHTPWQLHTVASHGMKTVTWDVIPRDWKNPAPDEIVRRVLDSARPGSIILLHDGDDLHQGTDRSATLQALPGIIGGLRAKGYEFVTLDKLLSIPAYLPDCEGLPQ